MNISDLAEDYLIDRKDGMRKLTACFLNEIMHREAENQIQARHYERTGKRKAHLLNLKSGSSHSEPEYSRDFLEWRNL
jgi:transposase-like protein